LCSCACPQFYRDEYLKVHAESEADLAVSFPAKPDCGVLALFRHCCRCLTLNRVLHDFSFLPQDMTTLRDHTWEIVRRRGSIRHRAVSFHLAVRSGCCVIAG
jgi:hypothetical protein